MQKANAPEASPPKLLKQARNHIRAKALCSIFPEMQYNQGHSPACPPVGRCK